MKNAARNNHRTKAQSARNVRVRYFYDGATE